MGTINDKLDKLNQTKTNIKNELRGKGATVLDTDTFGSYAGKIHDLEIVNAQTKTVNPSTSSQTVIPDSEYNALSQVTINPVTASIDSNIVSSNIKSGISILSISGKSSVVDTEDSNAVADDIMHSKTAYVNGSKLTGTLNLDTEIANQTALITQLENAVQGKAGRKPEFENGDMSSLNSAIAETITAFTNYLDEQQEHNTPYLNEPITIYTPDEDMKYFFIALHPENSNYRIFWSKTKYVGIQYASGQKNNANFLETIGIKDSISQINRHNADWEYSLYGSGKSENWLNINDTYKSDGFSSLTNLINAISNPNSGMNYTHPSTASSYGVRKNTNYITNMICWKSSDDISTALDTIVTTQKLSNNVTILPLNS